MQALQQSELVERGFARYSRADIVTDELADVFDDMLANLREEFTDLPPDSYAPSTRRYRRYGRAVILPWSKTVNWIPPERDPVHGLVANYYQGYHNPEYPGLKRIFPAIRPQALRNPLLEAMLMFDFSQTFWDEQSSSLPIQAGVHFVKLLVEDPADEAISSPNCLHQDGEPFTFAHLIARDNVVGGVNTIAPTRCAGMLPDEIAKPVLLDQFVLEHPLDSYGVCDAKVAHFVNPIRKASGFGRGERCVVLTDFTPFSPQI